MVAGDFNDVLEPLDSFYCNAEFELTAMFSPFLSHLITSTSSCYCILACGRVSGGHYI